MAAYLMGIDVGTTVLKMGLFNAATGAVLASAQQRLPVAAPQPGARETPPAALIKALRALARQLRNGAGDAWDRIEGVGLSAQGGSSIIADRTTGDPLTPMYLWNDERCHGHVRRLGEAKPARYWSQLVSYAVPPTGLGRMLWIKEQQPRLFQDANIHAGAGEFAFFALTGLWRQDAGNAIQIGSYHAYKKRLDGRALALIDVPLSFVAPLRRGHETASLHRGGARLLGLPEGVPIAGPYIDQEAGYMSVMGTCRAPLHCSLGTAWVGNFMLDDDNPWASSTQMVLPSPHGGGRLVVQALPTGNVTWEWALRTFLGGIDEVALDKAAAIAKRGMLPPEGVTALPWFTQGNPLLPECNGGGGLLGISADTEPDDLVRAVAAGLVFELYRFLGSVTGKGGSDAVVIGGGASKSAHFRKLIRGVFHPLPVHWQKDQDLAAARGSLYALSAHAAQGATRMLPPLRSSEVAAIQVAYERYRTIFSKVYGTTPEAEGYRL